MMMFVHYHQVAMRRSQETPIPDSLLCIHTFINAQVPLLIPLFLRWIIDRYGRDLYICCKSRILESHQGFGFGIEDIQQQPQDLGSPQASTRFVTILILQDFVLGMLSLFEDTSQSVVVSNTSISSYARVGFVCIQQGSLSISKYEIGFLKQANILLCFFLQSRIWYWCLSKDYLYHFIWYWII